MLILIYPSEHEEIYLLMPRMVNNNCVNKEYNINNKLAGRDRNQRNIIPTGGYNF
jgi:hypothetical protein